AVAPCPAIAARGTSMNTCMDIRESLNDYVDGDLTAEEAAVIDAHVRECAACREELEALQALQQAAQELPRDIMPARDLWPEIAQRIEAESARSAGNIVRFRSPWMQFLAA